MSKTLLEISQQIEQFLDKENNKFWLWKKLFGNKQRNAALAKIVIDIKKLHDPAINPDSDQAEILKETLSNDLLLLAHQTYTNPTVFKLLDELYFKLTFSVNQTDTLTVLSPGTMVRSDRAEVASTEAVKQFKNVILLEGVGISAKNKSNDNIFHPIPGLFDSATFTRVPKSRFANNWFVQKLGTLLGILRGTGEDNNINYIIHILKKLRDEQRLPKVLNLVGFSRGDVQNIKLANKIYAEFGEQIQINLIGEPVAGPGNKNIYDNANLPPNVKFKISFLSLDAENIVKKYSNIPQNAQRLKITDLTKTKHLFLPSAGTHKQQDLVENGQSKTAAYKHNYVLITEFLLANGAKAKQKLEFSSDFEHCDMFLQLFEQKQKNRSQLPGSIIRDEIHQYVKYPEFFIHELHNNLFQHLFPTAYRVFFLNNLYISQDKITVANEMQTMSKKSPRTYQFLVQQLINHGIIKPGLDAIEQIKNKQDGYWSLVNSQQIYRSKNNLSPTARESFSFFHHKLNCDKLAGKAEKTYIETVLSANA